MADTTAVAATNELTAVVVWVRTPRVVEAGPDVPRHRAALALTVACGIAADAVRTMTVLALAIVSANGSLGSIGLAFGDGVLVAPKVLVAMVIGFAIRVVVAGSGTRPITGLQTHTGP